MTRIRSHLFLLLIPGFVLGAACGDDTPSGAADAAPPDAPTAPPAGPYGTLPLTSDIQLAGLDGAVHVARDHFGIAHIHAESLGDLAFAQGYVMAHDRLPQMDLLRRFGDGTLSELFGAASQQVIETDLEMRMHRMRPIADAAFAALQASSEPQDVEIVTVLQRFAEGVNAYADHLIDGRYRPDSVAWSTVPVPFRDWVPADSLVLGRFQAFALSWTAPLEIEITDIHQRAVAHFDQAPAAGAPDFDAARDARRGASRDLLRMIPVGRTRPIDAYPAAAQTTTKTTRKATTRKATTKATTATAATRARVPDELLQRARKTLAEKLPMGPHAFITPRANSNNWVVGPAHTGGPALIAGDQHLSLSNPSIFYPTHLVIPDKLDVEGITFPGIPGVVLGHNGQAAWSATVVNHDVNDVYLETVVPCTSGQGDCVRFNGQEVAIETWTEDLRIGINGEIIETRPITYEVVPHHGPIIPTIENGALAPRTGATALSVRYTGYEVTHELRATYELMHAANVTEAMDAFRHMGFGAQNWVFIDKDGNIGWTTAANVPLRSAASYAWDPVSNAEGAAPFFILSGEGGFEWEGNVPRERLPQAYNPARGYLATANSDPVGATFDGNPFNDATLGDRPLYVGAMYATGLRTDRINTLIQDRVDQGTDIDLDYLASIQLDSQSTFGARMRPYLIAALGKLDNAAATQDVIDWAATQDAAVIDRVRSATAYLQDWSLATPPAMLGTPGAGEIRDSAATTLFNVWVHHFIARSVGDEYGAIGRDPHDIDDNLIARVVQALFEEPGTLGSGLAAATGQPVLCDDMATADVTESCDLVAIQAMEQTLAWLAGADAFATEDVDQWRWGKLHTLTLQPLIPHPQGLTLVPPPDDPNPALRQGYPRAGDNFVVNRADSGYGDLVFRQGGGPAQRFLAGPGQDGLLRVRMALPGGTIYDRTSPHYRDLMDDYYINGLYFTVPFTTTEITSTGEERWVLRSP